MANNSLPWNSRCYKGIYITEGKSPLRWCHSSSNSNLKQEKRKKCRKPSLREFSAPMMLFNWQDLTLPLDCSFQPSSKSAWFGIYMCMRLYLKWTTNMNLLCSTWNCSMLCGSMVGRRVYGGRMDTYICMTWLSPSAVHLKLSQHSLPIGYTPVENKKVFFFF